MEFGSLDKDWLMDLTKIESFKQKIVKVCNKWVKIKRFIECSIVWKMVLGKTLHRKACDGGAYQLLVNIEGKELGWNYLQERVNLMIKRK